MKKVTIIGMMALMCAVACQREAQIEDNPNYNPETKEVTAEFVMSVATNRAAPVTKMTQADVQDDGSFRGMDRVHLLTYDIPYTGGRGNDAFVFKPADESAKATRNYDLSTVLVANEISANQSSKVLEMSLPLQTNAVVLYGIAPRTKSKDEQGAITGYGDPQGNLINNVYFKLDDRLANMNAFNQFTDLISRILTGILRSGYFEADNTPYRFWWPNDNNMTAECEAWNADKTGASFKYASGPNVGEYIENGNTSYHNGYTMHVGYASWRQYGLDYAAGRDQGQLEEMMGEIYQTITTIRTNGYDPEDPDEAEYYQQELRAGSAQAVFRLSEDVYQFLLQVENGWKTTWQDYVAGLVAKMVHQRAQVFFYEENREMVWRPLEGANGIIEAVNAYLPDRQWESNYNLITDAFFNRGANQPGFPLNLGLPAGAALMTFEKVSAGGMTFDAVGYLKKIPSYGMGGGNVPVQNYRYPAEVVYWTNSSLRTTTEPVSSADYPKKVENWDIDNWAGWTAKSRVQSTTRGVAVTKEINYGSALLKTHVKYGAAVIHDNNSGIHTQEPDNEINVEENPNQFKVTGLIIGGVNDKVGWDFIPVDQTFDKLVYDRLSSGQQFYIPSYGNTSTGFYTMTWDNYDATLAADAQSPVYIALELVNNTGKDIWGGLNLIRSGGTFYMVGKLDPTNAAALSRLPKKNNEIDLSRKNFNYPPYDENGNTLNVPRVFMQDYVTEVTFSFNKHSLRNAYVTMPDLKASNVSLGLSVELTWTDGMLFSDVPLGGETPDND